MKKFIHALVQSITRFAVGTLMFVTPTRIQIHVFSRLIDACLASEKFDQELFHYIFAKTFYRLNPGGEKPEVPVLVQLYNAFVFAHETLSNATPPRPNEKRRTFQKIPTL